MKTTREHTAAALATVQALHHRAKLHGDPEAIEALRDVALRTIGILDNLTSVSADHPETPEAIRAGVNAAHEVARRSLRWPVALDAVKEIREARLSRWQALQVGSATGIKLAGKSRGFGHDQYGGFALDVFNELEAIRRNPASHIHAADSHPALAAPGVLTDEQSERSWQNLAALLPPLFMQSLEQWTAAGVEFCRDECGGDWNCFPWPDCVIAKAGKDTDGNGSLRSTESAIRGKLKDGLKTLI